MSFLDFRKRVEEVLDRKPEHFSLGRLIKLKKLT